MTQNKDGSFQYRLGDGSHMLEGTAGGVATLALMRKLDFPVLIKGAKYLVGKQQNIIKSRFPFYGHFYSVLGMKLVHEEMGKAVPAAKDWHKSILEWLKKDQDEKGFWKLRGWMCMWSRASAVPRATEIDRVRLGSKSLAPKTTSSTGSDPPPSPRGWPRNRMLSCPSALR